MICYGRFKTIGVPSYHFQSNETTMAIAKNKYNRNHNIINKKLSQKINKPFVQNQLFTQPIEADEEIRTLDPLLGKEMLYH